MAEKPILKNLLERHITLKLKDKHSKSDIAKIYHDRRQNLIAIFSSLLYRVVITFDC